VGIHHLVLFDWIILIAYFSVLAVLSMYGLHRYEMIRGLLEASQAVLGNAAVAVR